MNKEHAIGLLILFLAAAGVFAYTRRPVKPVGNGGATGTTTPTSTQASSSVPFENLTTIDIRPLFQANLVTDPLVSRNVSWGYELTTSQNGLPRIPDTRDANAWVTTVLDRLSNLEIPPYAQVSFFCLGKEKGQEIIKPDKEPMHLLVARHASGLINSDRRRGYLIDKKNGNICNFNFAFDDDPADFYQEQDAFKDSEPYIYYVLNTFRFLDE